MASSGAEVVSPVVEHGLERPSQYLAPPARRVRGQNTKQSKNVDINLPLETPPARRVKQKTSKPTAHRTPFFEYTPMRRVRPRKKQSGKRTQAENETPEIELEFNDPNDFPSLINGGNANTDVNNNPLETETGNEVTGGLFDQPLHQRGYGDILKRNIARTHPPER